MSLRRSHWLASLVALQGLVLGCPNPPSATENDQSTPTLNLESVPKRKSVRAMTQEELEKHCKPGFEGRWIAPQGKLLQRETAQTKACPRDECGQLTSALLSPRHFSGDTCDEVHQNIKDKPLLDAWGARARVTCNEEVAQAISPGRDGILGTCDDLSYVILVKAKRLQPPPLVPISSPVADTKAVERCGADFQGHVISPPGEVIQSETGQVRACPGEECPGKTLRMISIPARFQEKGCDEIRKNLAAAPISDAWGARVRVMCNGDIVQALSAGRDGEFGTCDDLVRWTNLKAN